MIVGSVWTSQRKHFGLTAQRCLRRFEILMAPLPTSLLNLHLTICQKTYMTHKLLEDPADNTQGKIVESTIATTPIASYSKFKWGSSNVEGRGCLGKGGQESSVRVGRLGFSCRIPLRANSPSSALLDGSSSRRARLGVEIQLDRRSSTPWRHRP